MARRPFDSNFSRRPTSGAGSSQFSLLGEPSGVGQRGGTSAGGGYDDYVDDTYRSGEYEEVYDPHEQDHYERVPREGGGQQRSKNDSFQSSGGGGDWRQKSPQKFSNRGQESERVSRTRAPQQQQQHEPQWTRPQQSTRDVFEDRSRLEQLELQHQQQQFQQSNPFVSAIQNNGAGILRNPLSNVGVMVLPHGQAAAAGGLMGNMGMVQTAANPFGVLGQQQVILGQLPFNQFGQQIIQQTPVYGQGVGQQPLNIYGPQTQQGLQNFNRFEVRSGSSDGRRSGSARNDRTSSGPRRSDSRTPVGTKPSAGPVRNNDPTSRKRNLVLRDPRPDEAGDRKRARQSGPGTRGNRGGGKGANKQGSGKVTQVKRVTLGNDKPVKDNRYKRKSDVKKPGAAEGEVAGDAAVKKEGDGDATGDSKNKDGGHKKEKKEKDKDRKTKYDEFPTSILVCKVCQKAMNDGASFESHLSGRAHVSLLKILEERFTKRSELLMIESKCAEEEIGIEMERQRRAGKGGRPEKNSNNYCKMCDCNYTVNWGTHKVSLGHRVLKEFLHPTCRFCKSHFMHRIDWVTHLLSHSHLKRIHEIKTEGTTPLGEQESPYQDELFAINMELARDERPTNAITIRSLDGKESLTEEMKEILKNDRGEIELPKGEIPIPTEYDENVEIGEDAIVGVSGSRCRVCRVYIADDKDVEGHCKTKEHFNMYVSFLKRVVRHREHKEEERIAAEEKAKKEEEKKQKEIERAEKKKLNAEQNLKDKVKDGKTGDSAVDKESAMEVDGSEAVDKKIETNGEEKLDEDAVVILDEIGGDAEGDQEEGDKAVTESGITGEVIEDQNGDVEMAEQGEEASKPAEILVEPTLEEDPVEIIAKVQEAETLLIESSANEGANGNEAKLVLGSTEDKVNLNETQEIVPEAHEGVGLEVAKGEVPATPAKASSPQTATRGPVRGRGGPVRGTPARGRGSVQALKNVTPRVDTNFRGASSARGGQARGGRPARGSSPRGGGRGGRGRPAYR